jgi:hypothetical protein
MAHKKIALIWTREDGQSQNRNNVRIRLKIAACRSTIFCAMAHKKNSTDMDERGWSVSG